MLIPLPNCWGRRPSNLPSCRLSRIFGFRFLSCRGRSASLREADVPRLRQAWLHRRPVGKRRSCQNSHAQQKIGCRAQELIWCFDHRAMAGMFDSGELRPLDVVHQRALMVFRQDLVVGTPDDMRGRVDARQSIKGVDGQVKLPLTNKGFPWLAGAVAEQPLDDLVQRGGAQSVGA